VTNGNADCTGTGIESTFQTCNDACTAGDTNATAFCIDALNCYNNGGAYDAGSGYCKIGDCMDGGIDVGDCSLDRLCDVGTCVPTPGNCHDADLGIDSSRAGSTLSCNRATTNSCTILQPGEASCTAGTKSLSVESCP
jgi:hypothetical protein